MNSFRLLVCVLAIALVSSCTSLKDDPLQIKATDSLTTQFNLRLAQIEKPTLERLETMKGLGMNLNNLGIQRVFIYFSAFPSSAQQTEIGQLGITLYLDSWIPPVGVHPTGFLIADVPVDKLSELAGKDFVIRLDTAEQEIQPHDMFPSSGGAP